MWIVVFLGRFSFGSCYWCGWVLWLGLVAFCVLVIVCFCCFGGVVVFVGLLGSGCVV